MLFAYGGFQVIKEIACREIQSSHEKVHCVRLMYVFASVMHHIRPKFPVCEEVEPVYYGAAGLHQEASVQQQKLTHQSGLCQRHHASVWPDGLEGAVLPSQGHRQPPHHRKQIPRGLAATPAPQQAQHLPQLHHLLQRGDRWRSQSAKHIKWLQAAIVFVFFLPVLTSLVIREPCAFRREQEHHRAGCYRPVGPRGERKLQASAGVHRPNGDGHHQSGNVAGRFRRRRGRQRAVRQRKRHSGHRHRLQSYCGGEVYAATTGSPLGGFHHGQVWRFQHPGFSLQGGSFGTLSVFDRDLTPVIGRSHNKYVGTLLNIDPWVKETFDIKSTFSEKKAAQGGIRETVHDYRKQPRRGRTPSVCITSVVLYNILTFTPPF